MRRIRADQPRYTGEASRYQRVTNWGAAIGDLSFLVYNQLEMKRPPLGPSVLPNHGPEAFLPAPRIQTPYQPGIATYVWGTPRTGRLVARGDG